MSRPTSGEPDAAQAQPIPDPLPKGKLLGERSLLLTNDMVARYVLAVGAQDNAWYTRASPFGGPVCPAAILHYEPARFKAFDDAWRGRDAFNARVDWQFVRPVQVGQSLSLRLTVGDRWLKRGREYVIFAMEAFDESGHLAAKCDFYQAFGNPPVYSPPLEIRDDEISDLRVVPSGAELGRYVRRFTLEMSEAMASWLGPNFHVDKALALERGFADAVIAGPQFVCQMSELMTRIFGRGFYEGGALKINFLRPVLVNEEISAKACEASRSTDPDGVGRVTAAIWCENAAGQKTAAGVATARLVDGEAGLCDFAGGNRRQSENS